MWRLFHLSIVGRSIVSGTPQFVCLKSSEKFAKTNKRRRIIVHHCNASSHTSAQISAFLTGQKFELMGHPPYNLDLSPKNCFLLRHIKKKMRGQDFLSPEDAVEAFKKHVLELSQSEWKIKHKSWSYIKTC